MSNRLLPNVYRPKVGPHPIDRPCPRCGAGPGWMCRDQRARQQGTATKQALRPHVERRINQPAAATRPSLASEGGADR